MTRSILLSLLVSLLLCAVADGQSQCYRLPGGGWSCGQGSTQIGIINRSVQQSAQVVQQVQTSSENQYQRANEAKENNCLNVYAFEGDTNKGMANGFVVGCIGQTTYVLTTGHTIKGSDRFAVKYCGGTIAEATLLESDAVLDAAILSSVDLRPRRGTIAHFAESDVAPGGFVQWISFISPSEWAGGPTENPRSLRFSRGTCVSIDGSWFGYRTSHNPQQGQSGSPLTNSKGRVVGMVCEEWGDIPRSPPRSKLKAFVDRVMLQKTVDAGPSAVLPFPNDDDPVAVPACNTQQCEDRFAAIDARLENVEKDVTSILEQWDELGSIQGPRGADGKDATPEQIQAAVAAWMETHPQEAADLIAPHLPPIWFRKVDGRSGEELSSPVPIKLGEGFTFFMWPGAIQEN